jgi:hypothetical protein
VLHITDGTTTSGAISWLNRPDVPRGQQGKRELQQ